MIFGFVVEKNIVLPIKDPRRKFEGRVVFQGNAVKTRTGGTRYLPTSVGAFGLREGTAPSSPMLRMLIFGR